MAVVTLLNAVSANTTGPVAGLGTPYGNLTLSVSTTGTVSAFSVVLQGSEDSVNWGAIGSAITSTTAGTSMGTGILYQYFQAVLSGYSGTGTVTAELAYSLNSSASSTGPPGAGGTVLTSNGAASEATYQALPTASTSAAGVVELDGTASDIQAAGPSAVAGSSTKAAAANHVHPSSPVAAQTLVSAAASITFTSIPSGYSMLRLVAIGASATAAEGDRWAVAVNGDSGAHYDVIGTVGPGSGTTATGAKNAQSEWLFVTSPPPGDLPGASATAGVAGILEVDIPAYSGTTFQKVGLWRSGYSDPVTASADQVAFHATVAWRSTAAVTSVTISTVTGANLAAGTTALLYLS